LRRESEMNQNTFYWTIHVGTLPTIPPG